jgi:GT2 family glycosyltransferase
VLTWNAAAYALACLHSVVQQHSPPDTLLVVDNGSIDQTVARVRREIPSAHVLCNASNVGFAAGMNQGIAALQARSAPPDIVVLLNQDTLLDAHFLDAVVAPFADERVGAVGGKIAYPDGRLQHAGAYLSFPRAVAHHIGWRECDDGQYDASRSCEMVTGAAIALRMEALVRTGLFDTGYSPAYYEDSDLCWRLRQQGYQIVYAPQARLIHHESLSLPDETTRSKYYNRGRLRFVLKSYPLPTLLEDFWQSEQRFLWEQSHAREDRALRWAYIETIANLHACLHARQPYYPQPTAAETVAVYDMVLNLKETLSRAAYRRARGRLDTVFA